MSAYVALFFDIAVLAALGAVIYFSLRLSRQFNDLKADRQAFEQLIQALNVASSRAEGAVRHLKDAAKESVEVLQERTNGARAMADELEIMIQAGDNLAERLKNAATSRPGAAAAAPREDDPAPRPGEPRSRAERDLIEALKAKQKS